MKTRNERRFLIFLISLLFVSVNILTSTTNSALGEVPPLIYTESEELIFNQGSSDKIVWIVIDNDPKKYWITNTVENTEFYIQTEKPFKISRIEIQPVGIPIGSNIIKLYVEDYSNLVSTSVINVTINPVPFTSTSANTSLTSSSATTRVDEGAGSPIFLSIPAMFGIIILRLIKKKLKRREND